MLGVSPFQQNNIFNSNPYGSLFQPTMGIGLQSMANQAVPQPPEQGLARAINFYADYSGCGFWRLIWPEHLINANGKMAITGGCVMMLDPRFYVNVKSVRIQRQATAHQLEFVKFLKELSLAQGFHLIYEIDDIIFHEDIPEYNNFKGAFVNPEIRQVSQEIMNMCDEVTVTCKYMQQYYANKTGHPNVTVIPNYPPRWWIGNFYNAKEIRQRFEKNKKRPRILYPGSGAHFDVNRRVKGKDDFEHINEVIIKTRHKYRWVFLAAFPYELQPYIQNGDIEFHHWKSLYEYPRHLHSLEVNAIVAPLQANTFNRAKSDLKFIEASAFGIPAVCQDLETYSNAHFKFTTGDEMIAQLDKLFKNEDNYMMASRKARLVAESRFLENQENIGKYEELYMFRKGSTNAQGEQNRKLLN